jgi:hypothetical protein
VSHVDLVVNEGYTSLTDWSIECRARVGVAVRREDESYCRQAVFAWAFALAATSAIALLMSERP